MLLLSPTRWLPAKSPTSATLTLTSLISCTEPSGPPFVTRTMWVSDFPYRFSPSRIVKASLPFICGVGERAQQQRNVKVLGRIGHGERDRHFWVETLNALRLEVSGCVEIQLVDADR